MIYRKYPNPIDKYRVNDWSQARDQKITHEVRDLFVVTMCFLAAVVALVVQTSF